jgi:hypothetical protein
MSRNEERTPDDPLRNHPLRDTQEFASDIRARESRSAEPRSAATAIVGAFAGAVGGWWAGQAAANPAATITTDDDARYRALYEASPSRLADRSYEDVRPFYHLGHVARSHPDYRQRAFDEIEDDLQKGWTSDLRTRYGEWSSVRAFAREAYDG